MFETILNWILNTFIRNFEYPVRITISFVCAVLCILTLILSIRKKNDGAPLSIGWFLLTILLIVLSTAYIVL